MKIIQHLRLPGAPARAGTCVVAYGEHLYVFGGHDNTGAPTNLMYSLHIKDASGLWTVIDQHGDIPAARWSHNAVIWGEQLWLYDGSSSSRGNSSSSTKGNITMPASRSSKAEQHLNDLHRFEFLTKSWTAVEQQGCLPDRNSQARMPTHEFHKVVAYGPYLLAFGAEQQDENAPPGEQKDLGQPMLHAYDFCTSTWSWVPTVGSPGFNQLEGLFAYDNKLIAVGYQAAVAESSMQQGKQQHKQQHGSHAQKAPHLHVSIIDLTKHANGVLEWTDVKTSSLAPVPAVGAASTLCEDYAVFHGGWVHGQGNNVQILGGMYALNLWTFEWTTLLPPTTTASDQGTPMESPASSLRAGHSICYEPQQAAVYIVGGTNSSKTGATCSTTEVMYLQLHPLPDKGPSTNAADIPFTLRKGLAMAADLRPFCCNEALSDVIISVHGKLFPAHRVVLASSSKKFKDMLQQNVLRAMTKKSRIRVEVYDMYPEIMKLALEHMYGCLQEVQPQDALPLFSASCRYGLDILKDECQRVIVDNLNTESVTAAVLLADQHHSEALMEACIAFAASAPTQLQQIISSSGYLQLNEVDPRLGQTFVQAAVQHLLMSSNQNR